LHIGSSLFCEGGKGLGLSKIRSRELSKSLPNKEKRASLDYLGKQGSFSKY